jgi:hypothetical protein
MKKLILLLLVSSPLTFAQSYNPPVQVPDPCKGDVACQYKALDDQAKKEKEIQEEKVDAYREELMETQAAQLEETQKQNELIEESIEINESQPNANDRQMEQEDPIEYSNDEVESPESDEVLK